MSGQRRVMFPILLWFAVILVRLYLPHAAAAEVAKPTVDMSISMTNT